MIFNKNPYMNDMNKEALVNVKKNNPSSNVCRIISQASDASSCPIIAMCYIYGETYGFTGELNNLIKSICEFYQIEEVV